MVAALLQLVLQTGLFLLKPRSPVWRHWWLENLSEGNLSRMCHAVGGSVPLPCTPASVLAQVSARRELMETKVYGLLQCLTKHHITPKGWKKIPLAVLVVLGC